MCTRYLVKCIVEAIFASIKVMFQKYYMCLCLKKTFSCTESIYFELKMTCCYEIIRILFLTLQ
jgi:hypothetical protein